MPRGKLDGASASSSSATRTSTGTGRIRASWTPGGGRVDARPGGSPAAAAGPQRLALDARGAAAPEGGGSRGALAQDHRGHPVLQPGRVPGGDHPLRAPAGVSESRVHRRRRRQHGRQRPRSSRNTGSTWPGGSARRTTDRPRPSTRASRAGRGRSSRTSTATTSTSREPCTSARAHPPGRPQLGVRPGALLPGGYRALARAAACAGKRFTDWFVTCPVSQPGSFWTSALHRRAGPFRRGAAFLLRLRPVASLPVSREASCRTSSIDRWPSTASIRLRRPWPRTAPSRRRARSCAVNTNSCCRADSACGCGPCDGTARRGRAERRRSSSSRTVSDRAALRQLAGAFALWPLLDRRPRDPARPAGPDERARRGRSTRRSGRSGTSEPARSDRALRAPALPAPEDRASPAAGRVPRGPRSRS